MLQSSTAQQSSNGQWGKTLNIAGIIKKDEEERKLQRATDKEGEQQRERERLMEEKSRRLSTSHFPEVGEVREECFQGLEPRPTRALLRMRRDGREPRGGTALRSSAPVHLNTAANAKLKVYSPQIGLSIIHKAQIITHSDHLGQRQRLSPPVLSSPLPAALEEQFTVSDGIRRRRRTRSLNLQPRSLHKRDIAN